MINLKDKLSHLSFTRACKLLGPHGKTHLTQGGRWEIDIDEQVVLKKDLFHLDLGEAGVTMRLDPAKNRRIDISCSICPGPCVHQGAALSLILEEKLGLLGADVLTADIPTGVAEQSPADQGAAYDALVNQLKHSE